MELILFVGGLLLLDLLAMRFGVDSRALNLRAERGWWPDPPFGDPHHDYVTSRRIQLHYEAEVERLASLARVGRTSTRIPSVNGLHGASIRRVQNRLLRHAPTICIPLPLR